MEAEKAITAIFESVEPILLAIVCTGPLKLNRSKLVSTEKTTFARANSKQFHCEPQIGLDTP